MVRVTSVEVSEGFELLLGFSNGERKVIDVEWLLHGPIFDPIREDPEFFRTVRVDEECGRIVCRTAQISTQTFCTVPTYRRGCKLTDLAKGDVF